MAKYQDLNNIAQHLFLMAIQESDWPNITEGDNDIKITIGGHGLDFNVLAGRIEEHFDAAVETRALALAEVKILAENTRVQVLNNKLYDLQDRINNIAREVQWAIDGLREPIDHSDDY